MPVQCSNCSAQLSNRRSLNKHMKKIDKIFPDIPTFSCFQCSENVRSLPTLRKHSHISHQQPILKVCYTCRVGFQSNLEYAEHINNEHGLPILDLETHEVDTSRPTVSSISDGVNYYEFEPAQGDLDIMEYLFRNQEEISKTVQKHTQKFPQKVQLVVEMTLQKPSDDEQEKLSMFFNTNTRVVYHSGISNEIFEDLVDNIVSKLVSFSSYGSGRQLLSIDKVTLKLAKYVLVRGSSFIPFHEGHPLRRDSNLLNIHNGSDNNCFLYCYTAGYHLVYKKEKLEPPIPCVRPRTNVLTYSREKPSAKIPKGNFEMPMSLHDISKFEDLNEVQVNVFR